MPQRRRITAYEKRIVAARQKWVCSYCNTLLTATFEVDHIVPLHRGGEDDYETNCHALCCECHRSKTQREEVERLRMKDSKKMGMPCLTCSSCDAVVSPYFIHRCDKVMPRLPTYCEMTCVKQSTSTQNPPPP